MKRAMQQAVNKAQGKRWQWPGERNMWNTGKKRARGKMEAYSGPSKRTRAKRAAKALHH